MILLVDTKNTVMKAKQTAFTKFRVIKQDN